MAQQRVDETILSGWCLETVELGLEAAAITFGEERITVQVPA
jgi:hypothetical protein